jgi:pSer/pThr/pTyr-binding forkhead associated (FHA) protein
MVKHDVAGATLPTLLPIFGGADKKPRPLDRDVLAIGRARGCDIVLEANEVSAVHCIFYRAGEGMRLRDCGSRTGTRVNGAPVKNVQLANTDVVQIGPFSFEVRLPPAPPAARPGDDRYVAHLYHSRRKLAGLALTLRRKLKLGRRGQGEPSDKAAELKTKIRNYDERFAKLEAAEAQLAKEKDNVVTQREAHARHVQQIEGDLARRLEETEAEIRAKWAEFQKRCGTEQERWQDEALKMALASAASNDEQLKARLDELAARDEQLRQQQAEWKSREHALTQEVAALRAELDKQRSQRWQAAEDEVDLGGGSGELSQREEQLKQQEAECQRRAQELTEATAALEQQREELAKQRSQWQTDMSKSRDEVDQQRVTVGQAETALREQKAQLAKMVADIKRMQEDLRKQGPELKTLAQENQQLKQQLTAAEERLAGTLDPEKAQVLVAESQQAVRGLEQTVKRLSAENETLRDQVAHGSGAVGREVQGLRKENEQLRQLLQTQLLKTTDPELETLRAENQQLRNLLEEIERTGLNNPAAGDVEQVQAENELLRQLLQERDKAIEEMSKTQAAAPGGGELPVDVEAKEQELVQLRAEAEDIRKRLAEFEAVAIPAPPTGEDADLDRYEADLNKFRRQVEADRLKLNREIDAVRLRNTELDEATREMEMELSRERAELARERMRLDRLREEIKSEAERLQRDGGVRESLASFQRLREEMRPARR